MLVRRLKDLSDRVSDFVVSIHTGAGYSDAEFYDIEHWEKILHPLSYTCSAGKVTMGILSNGDCVPCLEIKNPKMICGNILHEPLAAIWSSKPMSLVRRTTPAKYNGKCGKCELKWTCYSARCIAYNLTGDILGDDVSCYRILGKMTKNELTCGDVPNR
jgi:radical SAM protein with 4Fe4S-binding SPASM domain